MRLRVLINQLGNITDVKLISGNALLVPPAVAIVKRFPYRPFIHDGHRVAVSTEVDIPFVLHPVNPREIYDGWMSRRDAARILRRDGQVDAAVENLREALEYAEKIGDIEVADTYGDLAELYLREGRLTEAEPFLVQRLHTLQHSRIQDELEIANTEADLGGTYVRLGKLPMAWPLLERAVPIQERHLRSATLQDTKDAYAQRLALSLGYSALLNELDGKSSDAELLYKRAIHLGEKTLPADSEATIMRRYAELLAKTGRRLKQTKSDQTRQSFNYS